MTTLTTGTVAFPNAMSSLPPRRTRPVCSALLPTRKPGMSISEMTGSPNASHIEMKRAALSQAGASRTPASDRG
jgi:hypothetical protein